MDTLILAATSFIICISLMITGKKDKLQASFACLCAAVFVSQAAIYSGNYFNVSLLHKIRYLGSLALVPFVLAFFRQLIRNKSLAFSRILIAFTLISLCGAVFALTPLSTGIYFDDAVASYTLFALVFCYVALMRHVKRLPSGNEKRRLSYLLFACPTALILGNIDLLNHLGFNLPVINGVVLSALLYFVLLVIAYPQLRELHDFFGRSLVIFVSTVTGAFIFYFAASLFRGSTPSVAGLLLASFLIVISLTPIKIILKNIFSYFYPESKDVFTSLYEFDEKLEKEKALMLAEMAPVVAHEIRNPLGSIKGAAQYLKEEATGDEQKALLNVIVEGTDRLNMVVSQFLDYARPYKLNLKFQNVNMIIQKAISVIAANKQVEKMTIVIGLDENLPEVEVDEQQLIQVIINIALNAIESMTKGGTLTFSTSGAASGTDGEVIINISDTGIGINKKEINDIFKPFFTTKERGVGLGLAICQKIIKEHGGQISVKSVPAQGTVFTIKLRTAS